MNIFNRVTVDHKTSRQLCLLVVIVALMLVSATATAIAAETPSDADEKRLNGGGLEQPNSGFADASELATAIDLTSVDPRNVYRVEDLETYGSFGVAPSTLQALNSSGWITAGNCTYRQHVDNPHWSDGYTKISVHGWWTKKSTSSCPSEANVDISLEAYWCNYVGGCSYINIASNSDDVKAGGGRGWRVNARNGCSSYYILISYRGAVDVDLKGQSDPSGLTYSAEVGRYCYPA